MVRYFQFVSICFLGRIYYEFSFVFIIVVIYLKCIMLPEDQIRFMLAILLSIPAGFILRFMPTIQIKKYFSIISATLLQYYVYQNQIFWALLLHVVIYYVIKMRGRQCGFFVTALAMGALAIYNVHRYITNYGNNDIDLSFILMLYVSKYSLFAFAYQDGGESLQKIKLEYRKQDRIVELPSFFDFIGYLQFVPTCILNTPVDYNKYDRYIKLEGHFSRVPLGQAVKKSGKDLSISLFCACLLLVQMIYFPISYIKTEQFLNNNVLYVYFYCFWAIALVKCKYYFAWKLSMLPVHISGVSYQPQEKGDQFLGVQTCNPWQIETTIHIREKINNWNMTVQQWLKKCVYDRLNFSKSKAQILTFAVSAFWHGIYGGYYLSFFFWFMQLYASGLIFKFSEWKEHPLMQIYTKYEPYSFWVIWFVWNFLFTHNGLYFHVLQASGGFKIIKFFNFVPIIFMVICIVVFIGISKKSKGKPKEKQSVKVQ